MTDHRSNLEMGALLSFVAAPLAFGVIRLRRAGAREVVAP
jgi:hypothetical protein